jgi:CheY-like chemotaxis protein
MTLILLVEDNVDNRDMLARRLQRKGFDVKLADNGQVGIELAQECHPDLILMDLSMPVLDGWEATRRIKANPALQRIPIIALTGTP